MADRNPHQAWELHLAGVPAEQVAEATGLTVVEVADAISRRAPTARDGEGPEVELARLNRLWRAVYPDAVKGDLRAHQVMLRLQARRLELQQQVARSLSDDDPMGVRLTGDDERANLVALRDMLGSELERTKSRRDIASLTGRYLEVLARVAELDGRAPSPASAVDEIAERRRRRRPIRDGVKREA